MTVFKFHTFTIGWQITITYERPQFLQLINSFEFPGNANHKPLLLSMDGSNFYTSFPYMGASEASKYFNFIIICETLSYIVHKLLHTQTVDNNVMPKIVRSDHTVLIASIDIKWKRFSAKIAPKTDWSHFGQHWL